MGSAEPRCESEETFDVLQERLEMQWIVLKRSALQVTRLWFSLNDYVKTETEKLTSRVLVSALLRKPIQRESL